MLPVVAGKYKVWTKKMGSGPIKVLLLHGGPGFSHEYLEAFESFLPQAGIEMYYYDQLGCNNSDQPDDPGFGLSIATPRKWRKCGAASDWNTSSSTDTHGAESWPLSTLFAIRSTCADW